MPDPINDQDARRLVEAHLAHMKVDWEPVIVEVREFPVGWVFFYDSKVHQETNSVSDALAGNAPILVDRSDGTLHMTGTAQPIQKYVDQYLAGK